MPELTEPMLATYVLIVVRLSTALVVMPMFGARGVPAHTKIVLARCLGQVVVPLRWQLALPRGVGVRARGVLPAIGGRAAAAMAPSVPLPMARPTSAWARAGASLMPSPTIPTVLPWD